MILQRMYGFTRTATATFPDTTDDHRKMLLQHLEELKRYVETAEEVPVSIETRRRRAYESEVDGGERHHLTTETLP